MAELLISRFGFPPAHVRTRVDSAATREGILAALQELRESVGSQDIVVLFYAGHGSQIPDREGTKPTCFDQTIVPHDSARNGGENRDISDDEIGLWLLDTASVAAHVTMIFDCCHSGTLARGSDPLCEGAAVRGIQTEMRPVSELPPSPIPPERWPELAQGSSGIAPLPRSDRYVVLSACHDEEKAHEYILEDGPTRSHHGALTYFFAKSISEGGLSVLTYRDAFERAAAWITSRYPRQHPCCEGAIDRVLFGTEVMRAGRYVAVIAQQDAQVTLLGGAAQGLRVGSEWEVHGSGSQGGDGRPAIARIRIVAVQAGAAQAHFLHAPLALSLPCRAVELASSSECQRWPIATADSAELAALPHLLANSPWLRPAEPNEPARAQVIRLAPRSAPAAGSDAHVPLGYLGALCEPVLVVLDAHGQVLLPLIQEGRSDESLPRLRDELERLVRCAAVRAIENHRGPLARALTCTLLLGPSWLPAPIEKGRVLCREGDRVAIELRNVSAEPVYVTAIVIGTDRSIAQIYPPPGAKAQRMDASRLTRIGAWRLCLPFELPPSPHQEDRDRGTAIMKLFVTREEVDFQSLLQEGQRGCGAVSSLSKPPSTPRLVQRLAAALAGLRPRGPLNEEGSEDEDWASLELEVVIARD